ncbi:MAG: histidine kinase dimerization/phospho-acceptor domain-containing protein, partial [Opitutales bacterium]
MLRTRLVLGLVSLLLLVAAVGAYAVWTTRELGHEITDTVLARSRGLLAVQRLKESVNHLAGTLRQIRTSDAWPVQRDFNVTRAAIRAGLRDQSALFSADPGRTARLAGVVSAFDRLGVRADSRVLNEQNPLEVMKGDEAVIFDILHTLDALADYDTTALQRAGDTARQVTKRTTTVFATGAGGAVLLAVVFAWTMSRALLRPIEQLTASAVALGEGRLDRDVPVASPDELGELARTFNTMAARLRTYRDAMTEKAQRAQRTMEATLTSAPDPLFVVESDGRHTVRNPAAAALAALPEFKAGWPDDLAARVAQVLALGEHYLPTDYSRVITVRDRHYLPRILAIGDKMTDFSGAAVILQDVTKFRLLDDAKSNLVGTVSHELKTPLTGLRLSVYLLLEEKVGPLTATQRELLETARTEADRLLRILNDLLDLSRLEGGMAGPELRPMPVTQLLQAMAAEIKPITTAADQRVMVTLPPAPNLVVAVEADRIRHVFINFLSNAAKYTPAGGTIELYADVTPDGYVRLGVRDSGPGITADCLPHVFEKFYRVPGQEKTGAGLGLAIAR